jgi:erythromycin esterase-like protein/predicted phosphoribosyltransferase/dienelactone hydrolase
VSHETEVVIGQMSLSGMLAIPEEPAGLIIFAHGSGSSRFSIRNRYAASHLERLGFATLLFDLLTEDEANDRNNVFDMPLLGTRVVEAIDWARADARTFMLPIGLFGASTGAGAAIIAAVSRTEDVSAIVSRGGRPDLAEQALDVVRAPTVLIVGGDDSEVLKLNKSALARMKCEKALVIIPGAGHLFEETNALEQALIAAGKWFTRHLSKRPLFDDRGMAGRLLAAKIAKHAPSQPVVYALPRGGVPVAIEVARQLHAPLDLLLVRKIGVPQQPELAAGAVVDGNHPDIILNDDIVRALGLTKSEIESGTKVQLKEIERRRAQYMPGRLPVSARGRTAILVDDGVATGASMEAAIAAVRRRDPQRLIIAVPVASQSAAFTLHALADEVVCLAAPRNFGSVGEFYHDFHQLTDREVVDLLAEYAPDLAAGSAELTAARENVAKPTVTPSTISPVSGLSALLRDKSQPLPDLHDPDRFAGYFDVFADTKIVLLGEATHGTADFYSARAAITERLVKRHGFNIVAMEADWPDAAELDRFVRQHGAWGERNAFVNFPRWMWRNEEFARFLQTMRRWNEDRPIDDQLEVRGLDVYSLHRSRDEVIAYLESVDAREAEAARRRYSCLTPFLEAPQAYGAHALRTGHSCEDEAVSQLIVLLEKRLAYGAKDGENYFDAEQNARVVCAAERYYRAMYRGAKESWNLRDGHMFETLTRVMDQRGTNAKAIVWAHNSHIGNAGATGMGESGEFNIGQLCRVKFGDQAALIGFSTDRGHVMAASEWGAPPNVKTVLPARADSWERVFRDAGHSRSLTNWRTDRALASHLSIRRLERAIGVIYRPESERWSHYFDAHLSRQFDALVWFEETSAVHALAGAAPVGAPDIYPFGL